MPALDTLIPRFKAADRQTRLETLLDYSKKLPPLPERYEAEKAQGRNMVEECQTPVYLWVEVADGRVHIHADVPRESPTVRDSSPCWPGRSTEKRPTRSPASRSTCSTSSASARPSA